MKCRSLKSGAFHVARLCFAIVLCVCSGVKPSTAQQPGGRNSLAAIQESHVEEFRSFSTELTKLIEFCEDKSLPEGAARIKSRLISPATQALNLSALPRDVQPELPAQLTPDERFWQTQLKHSEDEYAKKLYLLSRRALHSDNPGYAYRLVREAAVHNPDHAPIRKILGFERLGNEWVTSFAAAQTREGKDWHNDFGWLPKNHLVKYAADERFFKGRWYTTAKEKELRHAFADGWQVRTDHYLIKTNYSLERGVELGKALEDFYGFFNETFAGFFNTPEQLKKLFDGKSRLVRPTPYVVHYYRSRDEYLDRLKKQFPTIEQTNGVYMTNDRVAHFYHDDKGDSEATLFHEATHQLFFESHQANRPISEKDHFWIIEGIACYMESFQRANGTVSIGDPGYIRFAGARANLLAENSYYMPLKEFSGMGMRNFQFAPALTKNYTQAAGLARFFMHYENGRYREALVSHLSQLYSGDNRVRDHAAALDELTGVDFEELDRQYREDARQTEEATAKR